MGFQDGDMLADGRLGYFEPFSGPGEVPGFGRGDNVLRCLNSMPSS
ncbi:MAG: hypothetical protein CM1200mP2_56990 [Planctomycetaceae bacterium]|nr:MAG: hypothetical protein CM1200mP2_56990 [Planctomycetaceae bacterium]